MSSTNAPPMVYVSASATTGTFNKCNLTTYRPNDCPSGTTPHHLIPDSILHYPDRDGPFVPNVNGPSHAGGLCICLEGTDKTAAIPPAKMRDLGLDPSRVPTGKVNKGVLAATRANVGRTASRFPGWAGASPYAQAMGEHGIFHTQHDHILASKGADKPAPKTNTVTYAEARDVAASLCSRLHGCKEEDIKRRMDNHYKTAANNIHDGTVFPAEGGNSVISNPAVLGS